MNTKRVCTGGELRWQSRVRGQVGAVCRWWAQERRRPAITGAAAPRHRRRPKRKRRPTDIVVDFEVEVGHHGVAHVRKEAGRLAAQLRVLVDNVEPLNVAKLRGRAPGSSTKLKMQETVCRRTLQLRPPRPAP